MRSLRDEFSLCFALFPAVFSDWRNCNRFDFYISDVHYQLCFILEEPEKKDGSVCENGAA